MMQAVCQLFDEKPDDQIWSFTKNEWEVIRKASVSTCILMYYYLSDGGEVEIR